MPPAESIPANITAIARHHGLDSSAVVVAARQGVAGRVYFLGDHLALKAAQPGFAADQLREAVVIPVVTGFGVRTPSIVESGVLDNGLPYTVSERVFGIPPEVPRDPADTRWAFVYHDLGEQLAVLHSGVADRAALIGVTTDLPGDPLADLRTQADAGAINSGDADWLADWFGRLDRHIPQDPANCLIHGDISPTNLLADPAGGRLLALLDWGDSTWSDPAVDFAKLPLRAVPFVLAGYLPGANAELHRQWAARILRHHLHWAVSRCGTPAAPGTAHWSAPPGSRLLEVLRFFVSDPPQPWPTLR